MKTYVKCGIAAVAGAAVGAIAAWKIYDHRINKLLNECTDEEVPQEGLEVVEPTEFVTEDIGSVPYVEEEESGVIPAPVEVAEKPATFDEYVNIVDSKYHTQSEQKGEPTPRSESIVRYPEVIDADEFCEDGTYKTVYWTLYSDGIMTDDYGNKVENYRNILGDKVLSNFVGNVVHAIDDLTQTYYEVIKEPVTYGSVYGVN